MKLNFDQAPFHRVDWIRERPIAHRGLHDASKKIYENTLTACASAVRQEYAIEVDLQPSLDGVPMVFHDYELERMTGKSGEIRDKAYSELSNLRILDSGDKIPALRDLLELVDGEVGLVLELKGRKGADAGFVKAVSEDLKAYEGNVVIMSFHHHILEDARKQAAHLALGLTAYGGESKYEQHRKIAEKTNVSFVSYELKNLETQFVSDFRKTNRPIISWTVKNEADAAFSARFADQPTFEGFLP
ncbi:MAG: glycerophosphodiester phosphodiesterase family protein [Pseudomonadota bacterium]